MGKRYLLDLEQASVAVPPSRCLEPGAAIDLGALLAAEGWTRGDQAAHLGHRAPDLARVDRDLHTDRDRLGRLLMDGGVLVQPFIDEVVTGGEWSLMFFDGQFSHAVIKRARHGDFRVQSDFGGSVAPARPPAALLEQARTIIGTLPDGVLYARLDCVVRNDRLLMMELELIKPYLFLDSARLPMSALWPRSCAIWTVVNSLVVGPATGQGRTGFRNRSTYDHTHAGKQAYSGA